MCLRADSPGHLRVVSSTTACSTSSIGPSPRCLAGHRRCARPARSRCGRPRPRSAASSSIGARARPAPGAGPGAAPARPRRRCPCRRGSDRMRASGLSQLWPSMPSTIGAWLTPRPSRKRPPDASASSRWAVGRHVRQAVEDVGDAGGHDQALGGRQQHGGVGSGLAAHGLGDPQRAVAELLELGGDLAGPRRGLEVELAGPDAGASQVHAPRRYFDGGWSRP